MRRAPPLCLAAVLLGASAAVTAAPAEYTIESGHTYPSFKAGHMGISFWRGKFNSSKGTVTLDKDGKTGTVNIEIDASSVDFGHDKMNEHALKEDFFNVAQYPTITYTGTLVFEGDVPSAVDGELTMLGVTKPVDLDIHSFKCIMHPFYKVEACGADASASFDRADFGMTYGGQAGTEVELQIQVEALKKP